MIKKVILLLFVLIPSAVGTVLSQPFMVTAVPRQIEVDGERAMFRIIVTAEVDFKSSVFLSATVPALASATVAIKPDRINLPYTDTAVAELRLVEPVAQGEYQVVIEAVNGPSVARDTLRIVVRERKGWKVFTRHHSPYPGGFFALDRRNGVAWFGGGDSLRSFDGTDWTSYPWPFGLDRRRELSAAGIALDSSGSVWTVFGGEDPAIVRFTGGAWSVFSEADAMSGFTGEMAASLRYGAVHGSRALVSSRGDLWVVGASGLLRFDGTSWRIYDSSNSELPESERGRAIIDREGAIWIGGEGSLVRFDGTYWTVYSSDLFREDGAGTVDPVDADPANGIWLLAGGVVRFDGLIAHRYSPDSGLIGRERSGALYGPNGDIWLGLTGETFGGETLEGGLARFDGERWWHYTAENSGIPHNNVSFIDMDDQGTVWMESTPSVEGEPALVLIDGKSPPRTLLTGELSAVGPTAPDDSRNGELPIVPNPARDRITVRYPSGRALRSAVVEDIRGRRVEASILDIGEGEGRVEIDVSSLPAGIYVMRVFDGRKNLSRRFVVAR